jgi:hypothetical protein
MKNYAQDRTINESLHDHDIPLTDGRKRTEYTTTTTAPNHINTIILQNTTNKQKKKSVRA